MRRFLARVWECRPMAGDLCFYNERVEAIDVDGEPDAKPQTPWS